MQDGYMEIRDWTQLGRACCARDYRVGESLIDIVHVGLCRACQQTKLHTNYSIY